MRLRHLIVLFILAFCFYSVSANEIALTTPTDNLTQGDNFNVSVLVNVSEGDLHSLQFDIEYDSGVLTLHSISEGPFLSSDSTTTIFNYSSFGSGLANEIYNVRNKTFADPNPGINGGGVVVVLEFNASSIGSAYINLKNVIWLNSTFENNSVNAISDLNLINLTLNVSANETGDGGDSGDTGDTGDTGGGGSGGGGGSSSGSSSVTTIPDNSTNETDNNFEEVQQENETSNESLEFNDSSEDIRAGFSPLTGRIIDEFRSGAIFSSWVFYFVLILTISFVAVLLTRRLRKHYPKKIEHQKVSKY